MSKEKLKKLKGCRVGLQSSGEPADQLSLEYYDVLEITEDGKLRCHRVGTRFDSAHRYFLIREDQLLWIRLPDGHEYIRRAPDEEWCDTRPLN